MGHGQDIGADGIHLGVELEAEHPIAQVDHRGIDIFFHHPVAALENLQIDLSSGQFHGLIGFRREIVILLDALFGESVKTFYLPQHIGHLHPVLVGTCDEIIDPDGVEHFKRAQLPVEPPAHGIIDVDHVVGDFWNPVEGIDQRVAQTLPGVFGTAVGTAEDSFDPLPGVIHLFDHLHGGKLGLGQRQIVAARIIVVVDLPLAVDHLLFVESLPGLVSQFALVDHGGHKGGQLESLPLLVVGNTFVGVGPDVGKHIEPDQVGGPEGRALGPCGRRSGHRIDLLHRHAHVHHVLDSLVDRIDTDAVGDEIGGVLGVDHPLTESPRQECGHISDDLGIGFGTGDDFHESHIARRIEEMGDQKSPPQFRRQRLRHFFD